jgi:hypothetical protein
LLFASGATVPTDGTDGYQVGCIFQHTDGGAESALYVNEGSITSCDFNAIIPAGSAELADLSDVGTLAYTSGYMLVADGDSYEETDDIALPLTGSIALGGYASTAGSGTVLSATATRPVSFLFDDGGADMSGDIRATLSRVLLTVDQTAVTINALRGQIRALDGVDSDASCVVAPLQGYLELSGTGARSIGGHVAALRAAIEEGASGTTTVAASSFYAGLEVTLNSTRTYVATGDMAGIIVNISGGTSKWPIGLKMQAGAVVGDIQVQAVDAGSLPCVIFSGAATNDAGIVSDIGADTLWADGSLYISVVDGAGKLFQKQNDVWVDLQA